MTVTKAHSFDENDIERKRIPIIGSPFEISDLRMVTKFLPMVLIFLAGLLYLFNRARCGYIFNDEPFMVTLGQRAYKGDALWVDEWHISQLFSIIMLPFYAFFRLFNSSNMGILLYLRFCYCILWWFSCIFVSLCLETHPVKSPAIFLFLLFFSPLDNMIISYTSVGLMAALLIFCWLYKLPSHKLQKKPIHYISFSLLWAVMILCSPLMIVAYFLLFIIAIVGAHYEKKNANHRFYFQNILSIYRYALVIDFLLGALCILFFILLRTEIKSLFENIPYVFSDPEHEYTGLFHAFKKLFISVFIKAPFYFFFVTIAFVLGFFIKRKSLRLLLFLGCVAVYIPNQITAISTPHLFNLQMLYFVFLGVVAFALTQNKNWKLFICSTSVFLVYALLNGLGSNTGYMAFSMCSVPAGCTAVLLIYRFMEENMKDFSSCKPLQVIAAFLLCGVVCFQIASEIHVKTTRQYWDKWKPIEMSQTIKYGAASGIKTGPYYANQYTNTYKALTYLLAQTDTAGKSFLCCSRTPYVYLDADLDFATFSAWNFGYGDSLDERILDYQHLHPDKSPDIVFCCQQEDIPSFVKSGYSTYEYEGYYMFVKGE